MDKGRKRDIIIMAVAVILCLINKRVRTVIDIECIRWFMCCYFNDIVGAAAFTAYCSFVCSFSRFRLNGLWKIELLLLGCGLFWEFVTPLYRCDTVTDLWDIVAYLLGGLLYWLVVAGKYLCLFKNSK